MASQTSSLLSTWRAEQVKFPSRETVFDYWLDPETGAFEQWTKSPYFFSIDYDSRVTPMTQVTQPKATSEQTWCLIKCHVGLISGFGI